MLPKVCADALQEILLRTQVLWPMYWRKMTSVKYSITPASLDDFSVNQTVSLNNSDEWCSAVDQLRSGDTGGSLFVYYTHYSHPFFPLALLLLTISFCLVQCHFDVSANSKPCLFESIEVSLDRVLWNVSSAIANNLTITTNHRS